MEDKMMEFKVQFTKEGKPYHRHLTKDEELECGNRVQNMVAAKKELSNLGEDADRMTVNKLHQTIRAGENAVEIMTLANIGLVTKIADSYKRSYPGASELHDVIQDGMAGLLKAIHRYDPKMGNKLSTFATHWIYQSIARQGNTVSRLVRLPENRISELIQINRMHREHETQGISSTESERIIKNSIGLSDEDFRSIRNASGTTVSLDKHVGDDDDSRTLGDILSFDDKKDSSEETYVKQDAHQVLLDGLSELTNIQRDIIAATFEIIYPEQEEQIVHQKKRQTMKSVSRKHKLSADDANRELSTALIKVKSYLTDRGFGVEDVLN